METIQFQTIQSAIDHICSISTEEDLDSASQAFFDAQPALAGFVIEFVEDMSEAAKDLGFMMALILWESYAKNYPQMREISEDEVVQKFEAQESEMEKLLSLNDKMMEELQAAEESNGQPEVFNYITQELFSPETEDPDIDENEEVHLFMILKFFSGCLNEVVREGSSPSLKH